MCLRVCASPVLQLNTHALIVQHACACVCDHLTFRGEDERADGAVVPVESRVCVRLLTGEVSPAG